VLTHETFFEGDILMHVYIPVLPAPLRPGLPPQSGAGGARPERNRPLRISG